MNKPLILVVEDDPPVRNLITTTLKTNDYRYLAAANGEAAILEASSHNPDIVLLDLGLPDMDGVQVIRNIRSWSNLPIIVISARSEDDDKIEALDAGADDYITKPFGTNELLARIRTAIRHNNRLANDDTNSNRPYSAEGLVIDFEKRRVSLDGEGIDLTRVEYKIVSLLAKNSGKVLTYDSLIDQVWGPYADDNNRILRVNMANIRRKIEENPGEPKYIFTELGVGYRMLEDEGMVGGY